MVLYFPWPFFPTVMAPEGGVLDEPEEVVVLLVVVVVLLVVEVVEVLVVVVEVLVVVVVAAVPVTHWEYQSFEYWQTAPATHSVSPV